MYYQIISSWKATFGTHTLTIEPERLYRTDLLSVHIMEWLQKTAILQIFVARIWYRRSVTTPIPVLIYGLSPAD